VDELSREENAASVLAEGLSRSRHSAENNSKPNQSTNTTEEAFDAGNADVEMRVTVFTKDHDRAILTLAKEHGGAFTNSDFRANIWNTISPSHILGGFNAADLDARFTHVYNEAMELAMRHAMGF